MNVIDHALSYASRGWLVIPMHGVNEDGLCTCGQLGDYLTVDKHQSGKHPYTEHGYKDASKEHSQIYLWWAQWPDANVAIVTGMRSGLVVVDVDAKDDGYRSIQTLERKYSPLPFTVRTKSGGGGEHIFFKHPGFEVRGRRAMYPGVDVLADGGKVVSPPSRHKSGNRYHWKEGHSPEEAPLASLPKWLLTEIKTPRTPIKRRKKVSPWYQILGL